MNNVVRIEDVMALKQMGAPLDTPVEERKFSSEGGKRFDAVWKAGFAFWNRVFEYVEGPTERRLGRLESSLNRIIEAGGRLKDYADDLSSDDSERAFFMTFLQGNVIPFVARWQDNLEQLEEGIPFQESSPASGLKIWD